MKKDEQRDKVRRHVRVTLDPDSYEYRPETIKTDQIKADEYQRVAIYARVSTADPSQTTSFELQQKYYTEMVDKFPKWTLIHIYADEGKSGTTTEHRPQFLQMMQDAKEHKFDLIITKSVSRLNRNTEQFLRTIRQLKSLKIGVFFESENAYSLNQEARLGIEFLATMAAQESRNRSRSMESSLQMRLDHGLPLTPELLGLKKNEDGKLTINPETSGTPKLMFWMYLYGYSSQQIADVLNQLMRESYLGNVCWTANSVISSLRNERYCGEVLTRKRFKVFAADVGEDGQKTFKNRGERPQTLYHNFHDAIVSREDFLAVQRIIDNAKYGGTSLYPALRVIPEGLLKGFVIIHPHWVFTAEDYIQASQSIGMDGKREMEVPTEGSFDLSQFEVVDQNLFNDTSVSFVNLQGNSVSFNKNCIKTMSCGNYIEILVHPTKKMIAVRPSKEESRYAVKWARMGEPTTLSCQAYIRTLFELFGWDLENKYKLYGTIYRDGEDCAGIFSASNPGVFISKEKVKDVPGQLLGALGKRVRAYGADFGESFGKRYYEECSLRELRNLTREQWKTRLEGQACRSEIEMKITPYEELRAYIKEQLGDLFEEDQINE